jgi:hypothetical protein
MTKKAHELEFISRIKRDGSETVPMTDEDLEFHANNLSAMNEKYKINQLSIGQKTFIASGFNSYVVKLKEL